MTFESGNRIRWQIHLSRALSFFERILVCQTFCLSGSLARFIKPLLRSNWENCAWLLILVTSPSRAHACGSRLIELCMASQDHAWGSCLWTILEDLLLHEDTFSLSGSLQTNLAFASFFERILVCRFWWPRWQELSCFPIRVVHGCSETHVTRHACGSRLRVMLEDHACGSCLWTMLGIYYCMRIRSALADHCRLIWPCFILWAYFILQILEALLARAQLFSRSSCAWLLRDGRVDRLLLVDTFGFRGSLQIHLAFASFFEQILFCRFWWPCWQELSWFPDWVVHGFSDRRHRSSLRIKLADRSLLAHALALADHCRFI